MSGDQPVSPIPARFNRSGKANPLDSLVVAATTYGMMASPEQTEAMLRRVYGPGRMPGTESRRRSQMSETPECAMPECQDKPRSCGWCFRHCGAVHRHGSCLLDGCSKKHYAYGLCRPHYGRHRRTGETGEQLAAWAPETPRLIPSAAEIEAEMRTALTRLREVSDE